MAQERTIATQTMRRFILGRQGLWPGRRWAGKEGAEAALRAMECLQMDPVSVIARSHDLALWGRVAGYRPEHLFDLMYTDRKFFDYGGWLAIYPMDELPYWRVLMDRHKRSPHWKEYATVNAGLLDSLRERIRAGGPVRNRELDGKAINSYRSGKDSGYALYHMWLTGELMTQRREGIERVYGLMEEIAPPHLQTSASEEEAVAYFTRKSIAQYGLASERLYRQIVKDLTLNDIGVKGAQPRLAALVEAGALGCLTVESQPERLYFLPEDAHLLDALQQEQIPPAWQPLGATTRDAVVFLSPLEMASARGRAKKLFDFDYTWEIYKPAAIRKYGPYTLPVLYGDRLVARMDARLDRPARTLVVNLLALEDWFTPDEAFIAAFAAGLADFLHFLGAERADFSALDSGALRGQIEAQLARQE